VDAARDEFAARGCSVLVVSQAKPQTIALYQARMKWAVPVVGDPERAAYAAFGLERTGLFSFFKPRVLWGYLRGMAKGYRVKMPFAGEDVLQLGGDFLLARDRTVFFAYPSADPTDRPGVAALLAAIPSAPPMPDEPAPDATAR
jgi:hypothetical protein